MEERLFRDSFKKRMRLFEALIESVVLYGAEGWVRLEEEKIEREKRKYIKWIPSLDRNTPNYLIMEETKGEEIRDKALRRAIK